MMEDGGCKRRWWPPRNFVSVLVKKIKTENNKCTNERTSFCIFPLGRAKHHKKSYITKNTSHLLNNNPVSNVVRLAPSSIFLCLRKQNKHSKEQWLEPTSRLHTCSMSMHCAVTFPSKTPLIITNSAPCDAATGSVVTDVSQYTATIEGKSK